MADKSTAERIQQKKNRDAFSDFLAISQSTWYDWAPILRALLKEIAFLQIWDIAAAVAKKALHPQCPNKIDREGWCVASQDYLAARIGAERTYVNKAIDRMEDDKVIECRTWLDNLGRPHKEYRINREVIEQKAWPNDLQKFLEERRQPRKGGNKKANAGSFKAGNKAGSKTAALLEQFQAEEANDDEATCTHSRSHVQSQPLPTCTDSREPVAASAVSHVQSQAFENGCECTGGKSSSGKSVLQERAFQVRAITASDIASGSADASPRESGDGVSATSKSKPARPWNQEPTKYKIPLLNKHTYPELFGGWRPGMLVPKCNRCEALLHPNEPAHECEGYVPKLPYEDMADHLELMESQRETKREIRLHGIRDLAESSGTEDEPTKACLKCGDELTYEEAMEHECNMAEDDFMAEAAE